MKNGESLGHLWDRQVKCDAEQIHFLGNSAYIHIKAFQPPITVKLLPR